MNQTTDNILSRDRRGDIIRMDDPEYPHLLEIIQKAIRLTSKLNNLVLDDLKQINIIFNELIGKEVDATFSLFHLSIRTSARILP